jgi:hypothetical protein
VTLLAVNATMLFGYRVYRLSKGGPTADAIGGAILAALLAVVAIGAGSGATWSRWAALVYSVLFALLVMPVWTAAVLLPLPPTAVDYAFTGVYWVSLFAIAVTAVLV